MKFDDFVKSWPHLTASQLSQSLTNKDYFTILVSLNLKCKIGHSDFQLGQIKLFLASQWSYCKENEFWHF